MNLRDYRVSSNLITYLDEKSVVSESYRTLCTNIKFSSVDKKVKTILITSPGENDGKTVTACNLAITMSTIESRVLIIDMDLRKPNMHNQFKLANKSGLIDVILDEYPLKDAVKKLDNNNNLDILTSGVIPPNPIEIISSKKMKEFIQNIENQYDIIIIDSPPIGLISDGLILSNLVDGVILTIALEKTNIPLAKYALKSLNNVKSNILGAVITKIKRQKDNYYH